MNFPPCRSCADMLTDNTLATNRHTVSSEMWVAFQPEIFMDNAANL